MNGLSNRCIARTFSVSEHCVRLRLRRLSQRALAFQSASLNVHRLNEAICYDGLENFAGSQYDPNNINQAIGRDSLFIYDFNFAPLNRKGRISVWQRARLVEIEAAYGRYNPSALRPSTAKILARMHDLRPRGAALELLSDQHFQYRRALKRELKHLKTHHTTISSRACRNFQNILFSVNHADLLIRQRLAAFARETISFSKSAGAMCQKYALFMVQKNYMLPQFTKRHVRRPKAHLETPAQNLGLCSRPLTYSDIFALAPTREDLKTLNPEWRYFWKGQVPPDCLRQLRYRRA
jgi:hypothetical protein